MFKRKKKVALRDECKKCYVTKERIDAWGQKWCYVYNSNKVGHVTLNHDGTTSGDSKYIKEWKYI